MKKIAISAIASILCMLFSEASMAVDKKPPMEPFKPFELVGDWKFINSNTGTRFSGDVKIAIARIDKDGVMHGLISYDGRQTNDKCSTKPLFTNTPVPAEVVRNGNSLVVNTRLNCLVGESPRLFSWTFECQSGSCALPIVLPHGSGAITLKEQLQ